MGLHLNIFCTKYKDLDENNREFINDNKFVTELNYPIGIDFNAPKEEFINYIAKFEKDIYNNTPNNYKSNTYIVSIQYTNMNPDLRKQRVFEFRIPKSKRSLCKNKQCQRFFENNKKGEVK